MVESGRKTLSEVPKPDCGGEYGFASILAGHFMNRYRWANHRGRWMQWTGQVWKEIPDELILKESSEVLRRHYVSILTDVLSSTADLKKNKDLIKELNKRVYETTMHTRVEGGLVFLKGWEGFMTMVEEWDNNAYEFNVANGVLDLKTGEMKPHDPKDLFTKLAPVDYDQGAEGEMWKKHLDMFLPNLSVRREVQRSLGLSLVGGLLEERLDIWYGSGANGKTTTARALMNIFGDYTKRGAPDLLIQTKNEHHPTEIADLLGSRVVFTTEVGQNKRLAEAVVKDLTGGDKKKARYMRQDFFEFEQTFSVMLITNDKPVIRGLDEGIWRRIRLVPWEEKISEELRRPQEEVVRELVGEGSVILNWVLDGLKDWWNEPYWMAPEVKAATQAYRGEMDILSEFLNERCEFGPRYRVTVKDLYESYQTWCTENAMDPVKRAAFGKLLSARGIETHRTGKLRSYKGIRNSTGGDSNDSGPFQRRASAYIHVYKEPLSPAVTPVGFDCNDLPAKTRIDEAKTRIEQLLNIAKYAADEGFTTVDSVACELEDLFDGDDEAAETWFKKACENEWIPFMLLAGGKVVRS